MWKGEAEEEMLVTQGAPSLLDSAFSIFNLSSLFWWMRIADMRMDGGRIMV